MNIALVITGGSDIQMVQTSKMDSCEKSASKPVLTLKMPHFNVDLSMWRLLSVLFIFIFGTARAQEITSHWYNCVADMTKSQELKAGDIAQTKGFYTAGDGGAATYNIVSEPLNIDKYPADGWSLIALSRKGLYADILNDDEISICQLGAMPVLTLQTFSTIEDGGTHADSNYRDCHDNLMAYIHLCQRRNKIYMLTCPAGHFFTSPTFMVIGKDKGVRIRGASPKDYGHKNETTFHAMEKGQEYIWTISGAEHLCHKNYPFIQTSGVNISNISFSGQHGGGNYPKNQYSPIAALIAVGMCNSNFDNLNFSYIGGSCMVFSNVQECVFGFVSMVASGAFYKGRVMPCLWFAKIQGEDGFARKILGRTQEDYCGYKSSRNCSADYINYIDAEGIGGSIIHADKDAVFTHSEIGNIQWEGSFCDFSNMRNGGYDYIKSDGKKDYSADENTRKDKYPHEKWVRCGAFSGWGRDITIHAITHTWNPMGYLAWYDSTMYRVKKTAAIVLDKENMDKYCNVHLIDYNWRQEFPVCYIESPQGAEMHKRAFSLDTPILPESKIIRCYDGTSTPNIHISGTLPQNEIYPALLPIAYQCCHYEKTAKAPAHLTAYSSSKNGFFAFKYRANKHYIARVKPKKNIEKLSTAEVVTVSINKQSNEKAVDETIKCPVIKRYEEWWLIDLRLKNVDENTNVKIKMGGINGSDFLSWDCIYTFDTTPVYSESAPISAYNWEGRLWYDTKQKSKNIYSKGQWKKI